MIHGTNLSNQLLTTENTNTQLKSLKEAVLELYLEVNLITEIPTFCDWPNFFQLRKLYLHRNKISAFTIEDLPSNIEVLGLSNNEIDKLPNLLGCTNLKELYLAHNNIAIIDGKKLPIDLKILDASNNRVATIINFNSLQHLEDAYLYNNKISDLGDVSNLLCLKKLDISHNYIFDVNNLSTLEGLQKLYLDENDIIQIHSLPDSLEEITLVDNPLVSLGKDCFRNWRLFQVVTKDIDIKFDLPTLQVPPIHVISNGYAATICYFEDMDSVIEDKKTMTNTSYYGEVKSAESGNIYQLQETECHVVESFGNDVSSKLDFKELDGWQDNTDKDSIFTAGQKVCSFSNKPGLYYSKSQDITISLADTLTTATEFIIVTEQMDSIMKEEKNNDEKMEHVSAISDITSREDCMSDMLILLPHGAVFKEHILIKFPIKSDKSSNASDAQLLTCSELRGEHKWINVQQKNTPLKHRDDMYWFISDGYCFLFTRHFSHVFLTKHSNVKQQSALYLAASLHGSIDRKFKTIEFTIGFHCNRCFQINLKDKDEFGNFLECRNTCIYSDEGSVEASVHISGQGWKDGIHKREIDINQLMPLCELNDVYYEKVTFVPDNMKTFDTEESVVASVSQRDQKPMNMEIHHILSKLHFYEGRNRDVAINTHMGLDELCSYEHLSMLERESSAETDREVETIIQADRDSTKSISQDSLSVLEDNTNLEIKSRLDASESVIPHSKILQDNILHVDSFLPSTTPNPDNGVPISQVMNECMFQGVNSNPINEAAKNPASTNVNVTVSDGMQVINHIDVHGTMIHNNKDVQRNMNKMVLDLKNESASYNPSDTNEDNGEGSGEMNVPIFQEETTLHDNYDTDDTVQFTENIQNLPVIQEKLASDDNPDSTDTHDNEDSEEYHSVDSSLDVETNSNPPRYSELEDTNSNTSRYLELVATGHQIPSDRPNIVQNIQQNFYYNMPVMPSVYTDCLPNASTHPVAECVFNPSVKVEENNLCKILDETYQNQLCNIAIEAGDTDGSVDSKNITAFSILRIWKIRVQEKKSTWRDLYDVFIKYQCKLAAEGLIAVYEKDKVLSELEDLTQFLKFKTIEAKLVSRGIIDLNYLKKLTNMEEKGENAIGYLIFDTILKSQYSIVQKFFCILHEVNFDHWLSKVQLLEPK